MSRAQRLYQLQSLDSDIDKARQQLAAIAARLGESQALKAAKKAVEAIEHNLHAIQTQMRDLDLEVKSLSQKITQQEKMLYGGRAMSAKEAANLQDEVLSLKRRHSQREEALLEVMVEAETAEGIKEKAQAELANVKAQWALDQEKLMQTQSALQGKIAQWLEQRPTAVRGIDQADLSTYETLRPHKAGVAVVIVKNNVCQGCGMTPSNSNLQRARSDAELTYCDGCGRILYVA